MMRSSYDAFMRRALESVRRYGIRSCLVALTVGLLWLILSPEGEPRFAVLAPMLLFVALVLSVRALAVAAGVLFVAGFWIYGDTNVAAAELLVRWGLYALLAVLVRTPLEHAFVRFPQLIRCSDRILTLEARLTATVSRFVTNIPGFLKNIPRRVWAYLKTDPHGFVAWVKTGAPAVFAIGIALFFLPFGWFEHGQGDYGGDSSRLYFYDPLQWLKSMGLYAINPNGYGVDNPNFFMVPFLSLLSGMKTILDRFGVELLSVCNGLLLAGAFWGVCGVTNEIVVGSGRDRNVSRLGGVVAGLTFVFSQIIVYNWQKALYSFNQIAVYPVLLWLFLRFINRKNPLYLAAALILTVVFSVNFSLVAAPSFFAFFPLAMVWLIFYAATERRLRWFVSGMALFIVFFLGLHAFHLYPQILAISNPANSSYQNLFTTAGQLQRGLGYFDGVRNMVEPLYNLVAFHQYGLYEQTGVSTDQLDMLRTYGNDFLWMFFWMPITIVVALYLRSREAWSRAKRLYIATLVWFLALFFFMTANVFGQYGIRLYRSLFAIPGFSIFRSFYGVFAIPFVFAYAVLVGLAVVTIYQRIRHRLAKNILIAGLIACLCYGAIPAFTGSMVRITMNDTMGVSLANRFNKHFESILAAVERDLWSVKMVTMPLADTGYQIIEGQYGGAYVGPSPFSMLAGKDVFSGLQSFDYGASEVFHQNFFVDRVAHNDYRTLNRFFALLNIGYMFHNENPTVYRGTFVGWPYSRAVWNLFPTTNEFGTLARKLGYMPARTAGEHIMYQNVNYLLQRIYTPRQVAVIDSEADMKNILVESDTYDVRTAFIRRDDAKQSGMPTVSSAISAPPIIFREVNKTRYVAIAKNVRAPFVLVLSQAFHQGWNMAAVPVPSVDEGDAFVSPDYHGSVQNQNIADNRQISVRVDDAVHVRANTYANAWWVDPTQYAGSENSDGSRDLAFVIWYAPQSAFYKGAAIAVITLQLLAIASFGWVTMNRLGRPKTT